MDRELRVLTEGLIDWADGRPGLGDEFVWYRNQRVVIPRINAFERRLLTRLLELDASRWRVRCFADAIAAFDTQSPNTLPVVEAIQRVFAGSHVSLFWYVHGRLRLSATTCLALLEKARTGVVTYKKGEGRTGAVFQRNEPLRMVDGRDCEALPPWVPRSLPLHPESTYSTDRAQRVILVPVRAPTAAKGVLRVSRAEPDPPFTAEEERDLVTFGRQLGPLVDGFWQTLVYQALWRAPGLSVIVSANFLPEYERSAIVESSAGVTSLLHHQPDELRFQSPRMMYVDQRDAERAAELAKSTGGWSPVIATDKDWKKGHPVRIHYQPLQNPLVVPALGYILGVAQDDVPTTKLNDERKVFDRVLEQANIVYFQATIGGRTLHVSANEERIIGWSKDQLRNRGIMWARPGDRDALVAELKATPERRIQERIVQLRTRAGTLLHVRADLILRDIDDEEVIEGVYQVVDERVKLQEYLDTGITTVLGDRALLERLKERSAAELAFIASAGHQLRAPLANVVEKLRNIEEAARRGMVDVDRVARTRYLVSRSLEFVGSLSRLYDAIQGVPGRDGRVNLSKMTRELAEDFNPRLRRAKLDLQVDLSVNSLTNVGADPDLTRQILYNYYDNAVKYSYRDTTVLVRAAADAPGVDVVSRGLVIPPEEEPHIWERGMRGLRAVRGQAQGNGLGLYLVKRLCASMGAQHGFRTESIDGKIHNVFWITFPRS